MINTTLGALPEGSLARTVGLEDRPDMLALWIEWRASDPLNEAVVRRDAFQLPKECGDTIYTTLGDLERSRLTRVLEFSETDNEYVVAVVWRLGEELVRRDVHVILKQGSVVADAMASSF